MLRQGLWGHYHGFRMMWGCHDAGDKEGSSLMPPSSNPNATPPATAQRKRDACATSAAIATP